MNQCIRGDHDRAQTSNVSSASKLSSECLVTYLCVLSASKYFMMSKLLRKCSQRHPRVQCISDAFWECFKEPRVPLLWCLRRKTTPVSSSLCLPLLLYPGFHVILCPFPEGLNLQGSKHFVWGWSGSMNGYCTVSIVLLWCAIVEMPPERDGRKLALLLTAN